MSADNYLVVVREGKMYDVYEECASTDERLEYPLVENVSLKEAVKWAEQYCRDNIVEYGIRFRGV